MRLLKYTVLIMVLLTGCINSAHKSINPTADLSNIKIIHVEQFARDSRGLDKVIAEQLRAMGYTASTGDTIPENSDAIITYRDKWRWDMSMYLLSISIKIRDPDTLFPMANAISLHTSVTRQSPSTMIREALNNIFLSN